MNRKTFIFAVALFMSAATSTAFAAGVGFHAGMSIDPDDVLIGVRWKSDPIEESIYIVPSAEVGFGDITMIAGNVDAHYQFKTSSDLVPYAGLGLTVNWFDFDGGSDTEVGGAILGGVYFNPKWFFEAKIGLGDVPDAKLLVGFMTP
jgi:hypothetical protein